MNDVSTAIENNNSHMEERDIVELGVVSEDTHGHLLGRFLDGGYGFWGS